MDFESESNMHLKSRSRFQSVALHAISAAQHALNWLERQINPPERCRYRIADPHLGVFKCQKAGRLRTGTVLCDQHNFERDAEHRAYHNESNAFLELARRQSYNWKYGFTPDFAHRQWCIGLCYEFDSQCAHRHQAQEELTAENFKKFESTNKWPDCQITPNDAQRLAIRYGLVISGNPRQYIDQQWSNDEVAASLDDNLQSGARIYKYALLAYFDSVMHDVPGLCRMIKQSEIDACPYV